MVYNKSIVEDTISMSKITIIEMQLADNTLKNEIYSDPN